MLKVKWKVQSEVKIYPIYSATKLNKVKW